MTVLYEQAVPNNHQTLAGEAGAARAAVRTIAATEIRADTQGWAKGKKMEQLAVAALCLALLLTACGASGDADVHLGPNPGGGYFGANVNVGTIDPSKVYDGI